MKNNSYNFTKNRKVISFRQDRVFVKTRDTYGTKVVSTNYSNIEKYIKEYK